MPCRNPGTEQYYDLTGQMTKLHNIKNEKHREYETQLRQIKKLTGSTETEMIKIQRQVNRAM